MKPTPTRTEIPEAPANTPRPTMLVVDDNDAIRELMARALSDSGEVLTARDGVEAVEILLGKTANDVDLLITDRIMPRMGGDELARWFRSWNPAARVLIVSSEFPGTQSDPYVSYLAKPFDLATFQFRASRLLEERQQGNGLLGS